MTKPTLHDTAHGETDMINKFCEVTGTQLKMHSL